MEQQQNFLDSKTIIAIVLVGIVWFGWQTYIGSKYPQANKSVAEAPKTIPAVSPESVTEEGKKSATAVIETSPKVEKVLIFDNEDWNFEVSSTGMGLKNLILKKFTDRNNSPIQIGAASPQYPLATLLGNVPLNFQIVQSNADEFVGRAEKDGLLITKTLKVDSKNYLVHVDVKAQGHLENIKNLDFLLSEESIEGAGKTAVGKQMGGDPALWQSYFVSHSGSTEHKATSVSSPLKQSYEKVSVAALNGKYFGQAFVDDSSILPVFRTDYDETNKRFLGVLSYDLSTQKSADLNLQFYAGPKALATLVAADPRLEKSVNYGMFGWLASPLLKLMKWLYNLTQNYGVAIIVMTLLVRMAVMPFNIASYKSMKAMQVIQPHVNKLKEKYKDDPQAMNREMMKLMKEHNANPLMGCLPMLLQLPVFFALYQVLDHSIELYKAPFALWIHDLSLKDPFYVLPVLMGTTMFIQQKITPTAMDPAQAKVLQFMPIIFTALMISLPSGLTLYIFISTLFGIIQQLIFMRDRKPKTTPAIQAKA